MTNFSIKTQSIYLALKSHSICLRNAQTEQSAQYRTGSRQKKFASLDKGITVHQSQGDTRNGTGAEWSCKTKNSLSPLNIHGSSREIFYKRRRTHKQKDRRYVSAFNGLHLIPNQKQITLTDFY